jgi:hypothetical protein
MKEKQCIYYRYGECSNKLKCLKKLSPLFGVIKCKTNGVLDCDKIKAKEYKHDR